MIKKLIGIVDFQKVEIIVGTIVKVFINEKARNPAYILDIDFSLKYGIKRSSIELCENYKVDDLVNNANQELNINAIKAAANLP